MNTQLPYAFAKKHGVLVLDNTGPVSQLQHKPGLSLTALNEVRRLIDGPLSLKEISEEAFQTALAKTFEQQQSEAQMMADNLEEDLDLTTLMEKLPQSEDLLESENDAPIIRLLNALFTQAIRRHASDIHLETFEEKVVVRFRIDGVLLPVLEPNRKLAPLLVSRIKVMAKLDIAEKRLPQDGRISLRLAGRLVDVRVSTLPAAHGERVVMRILDKQTAQLDLSHLGMESKHYEVLNKLIHKPHGILLVTGPTGSGKTTTLYAALSELNHSSRNILTIEDPIEFDLAGIGQTQVNTKIEMTFAKGLRAILRQDPDIVMVGEIRDTETAEIAAQASLTGHLVLSTLHTNTAIGAITRLHDMGIDAFLIASSLLGVVAQRLVRVLCKHCKSPRPASREERSLLGSDTEATLFQAVGCDKCNQTGYQGRIGLYEVLQVNDTLKQLIHDKAGEPQLEAEVRKQSAPLHHEGYNKVLAGVTSIEEIHRVTSERQ